MHAPCLPPPTPPLECALHSLLASHLPPPYRLPLTPPCPPRPSQCGGPVQPTGLPPASPLPNHAPHTHTPCLPGVEVLSGLLSSIMSSLRVELGPILDASLSAQTGLKAFDFLGNCVLEEVQGQLAAQLPGEQGACHATPAGGVHGYSPCEGLRV